MGDNLWLQLQVLNAKLKNLLREGDGDTNDASVDVVDDNTMANESCVSSSYPVFETIYKAISHQSQQSHTISYLEGKMVDVIRKLNESVGIQECDQQKWDLLDMTHNNMLETMKEQWNYKIELNSNMLDQRLDTMEERCAGELMKRESVSMWSFMKKS